MNKNALFILPEFYPHSGAGISTFYIQLVPQLVKNFNKIKVIVGSGYFHKNENYVWQGIEVECLKTELYQKYLLQFNHLKPFSDTYRNIAAAWAMYEQANTDITQYDVIECTDFGHGYVPWVINGYKNIIVRLHGSASQIWEYEQSGNNQIESCLDRIIEISCYQHINLTTHSVANIKYWQAVLGNQKEIKFLLPYYQCDIKNEFKGKKEKIGLVLGRLQGWKGPEELVKCLENCNNEIKIEWYGSEKNHKSGVSWSTYLSQNYNSVFGKKLIYKGAIPHSEVEQKIQNALFGIVPSSWDMFNFTALEYMSLGTVVVVSKGVGAVSLIENGVNGYVVDMIDSSSFQKTINTVLVLSSIEYQSITNKAKETLKYLGSEKLIQEYIDYYSLVATYKQNILQMDDNFLKSMLSPSNQNIGLEVVLSKSSIKEIFNYLKHRIFKRIY